MAPLSFQKLIQTLHEHWSERDRLILQPYDLERGAGSFHTATALRALGPDPWNAAFVQSCRRPTDGRYGENPNRLQHYYQYQVILKPSPPDLQQLYLGSLEAIGIDFAKHDIRFVEDDWESPTLGAWGLGWEVWCDGMEVTQFTYFQQMGGFDCRPVSGEKQGWLLPMAPGKRIDADGDAALMPASAGMTESEQSPSKKTSYAPEKEEAALVAALDAAAPRAAAAMDAEDFEGAMAALAALRGPVDAFLDKVTVIDADRDKRAARLDLLMRMRDAVHRVADFSRIEG